MSSWEPFRLNPVHPNRLGDVLDLLLAEIVERYRQLIAHLIVNDSGDAYRTRLGQSFETSGDIDAITEQILAIHHHVANVHAYAKLHRLVGANTRILRGNRCLHRDRASHGIDRAGEIGDDTVPSGVENAAPMRCDKSVDNGPVRFQPSKRANLVAPHQPAVAGNVGGEDRRKFALYRVDGHACTSPTEYSETRNQPPDLFRRPSFLPVQRKTDGPLSGAARLPGGVGMNVSTGSIAPFGTLSRNDRYLRAPWEGGAFQRVQAPSGQPLQPEATGAVKEVTKWLKPSV